MDQVRIEINDKFNTINTRGSLVGFVNDLREKYPFLEKWCLTKAFISWGQTRVYFENIEKNAINDLSEEFLLEEDAASFKATQDVASMERFHFTDFLQPLSGTLLKGHQYACEKFEGEYISEFSLYYLGAHILSSIARYRPNIWMRSITHSIINDESADDAMLAILEKFMDMALTNIPLMVMNAFRLTY